MCSYWPDNMSCSNCSNSSNCGCCCCRLAKIVEPPRIVREMSWVCNYWPENMPYPYISGDRSTLSALDRPEIQRYCLMSVKDAFTDFHVDFGGTSVWYHILRVSADFLSYYMSYCSSRCCCCCCHCHHRCFLSFFLFFFWIGQVMK